MTKASLAVVASLLTLTLVLFPIADVRAAELQILAGGGMAGPLREDSFFRRGVAGQGHDSRPMPEEIR